MKYNPCNGKLFRNIANTLHSNYSNTNRNINPIGDTIDLIEETFSPQYRDRITRNSSIISIETIALDSFILNTESENIDGNLERLISNSNSPINFMYENSPLSNIKNSLPCRSEEVIQNNHVDKTYKKNNSENLEILINDDTSNSIERIISSNINNNEAKDIIKKGYMWKRKVNGDEKEVYCMFKGKEFIWLKSENSMKIKGCIQLDLHRGHFSILKLEDEKEFM